MALRVSLKMKESILLVFAISFAWSSNIAVEGDTNISEEEDAELERQLKFINKPAIKVIKTHYGDIYDCVDINKQPAFDHPLLKNHKIQMRPTSFPKGLFDKASSSSVEQPSNVMPSEIGLKNGCPPGSVPIRRTRKEDLIRVKQNPSDFQPLTDSSPGHHFVKNYVNRVPYHGAGAWIAVYNPAVSKGQFSNAVMWIENGDGNNLNSIQVGWTVNHDLHGDNRTRLFTYWTVDGYQKTGCFDTRCPGFVQVSTDMALGLAFDNTSVIDGAQYNTKVVIYKDSSTGNWWLSFTEDNIHIGYWPKSLFTDLSAYAFYVKWGAEVYSPSGEASPPMGSGRFPSEGANKACFFNGLQVIYNSELEDPSEDLLSRRKIDNPDCYDADEVKKLKVLDYYFFFGGPGGTNCGN
ncbi:hypothetical protein HHK36_013601 [Tetracentron sinense]|uniref:Neprosin PEP catalytic domain-containing protein n=1 Tax=Tetracentron sinense TaxID=13715 RepID=A0A834Z3L3_TETSI|nr:hypothetical protein HHK36_013601 [Tetracentron sinense]